MTITIYIAGVTWYARVEHKLSEDSSFNHAARPFLVAGFLAICLAILCWAVVPLWISERPPYRMAFSHWWISLAWIGLVVFLGQGVVRNAVEGISNPTASNVKKTIISGLGSIIYWDSLVALYAFPSNWQIVTLCLAMMIPVRILRKTIPPT